MPIQRPGRCAALVLLLLSVLATVEAQSPLPAAGARKALAVDDYTRWRSINNPELSSDGQWVAYVLQLTNTVQAQAKPELHLRRLQGSDGWRLRVGAWRVRLRLDFEARAVVVVRVLPRGRAYDRRVPRTWCPEASRMSGGFPK